MTRRRRRRCLRAAAVLLALLFAASEVMARGGRGGGRRGGGGFGGGGRSISRASPAGGGFGSLQRSRSASMQARPATRPAPGVGTTRPSAGTQPSPGTRPSTWPSPGTRPGAGEAAQAGEGEGGRWEDREDAREDWQQHLNDAREDRQEYWENVDWDEIHVYDDDEFEWNSGTWIVLTVGTAITYSAFESMRQQPGCNLFQTEVNGTVYYRCGSTWYIEAVTGGEVRYVAVEPPPGY